MKIVFQAPARLGELTTDVFVAKTGRPGAIFFRPLSTPRLYEDRIDLTVKSAPGRRTYPYKRADESVN
jgi:hypothetical protein